MDPERTADRPIAVPETSLSRLRQTWLLATDPLTLLRRVREECGDVFQIRPYGVGRPWIFAADTDVLTDLFRRKEDEVVAGEVRHRQFGYLIGDRFSLAMDGEDYLDRRRYLYPLLNGKLLFERIGEIVGIIDEELDSWPEDQEFRTLGSLDDISRRVIQRVIFGSDVAEDLDERCREFLEALKSPRLMSRLFQVDLGPWSPWGRFRRARESLSERLHEEVKRVLEAPRHDEDAISELVDHLGGEGEDARETIVQEMMGFLVGGAETTSKMMAWMLLDLLRDDQAFGRLREEVLDHLGPDGVPSHEDLRGMEVLHAVVEETLRYRSPGPFAAPRLVKRDLVLAGRYEVPADTLVSQARSETGLNDSFPAPHSFDPAANFEGRKVADSDHYPFGGGIRKCTGLGTARMELTLLAVRVAQRFDGEVLSGEEPEADGIGYVPEGGLKLRVRRRRVDA